MVSINIINIFMNSDGSVNYKSMDLIINKLDVIIIDIKNKEKDALKNFIISNAAFEKNIINPYLLNNILYKIYLDKIKYYTIRYHLSQVYTIYTKCFFYLACKKYNEKEHESFLLVYKKAEKTEKFALQDKIIINKLYNTFKVDYFERNYIANINNYLSWKL